MLRAAIAIIFIALAYAFDPVAAAFLPPGYRGGLSVIMPLAAFAVLAWAFVPDGKRTPSGKIGTPEKKRAGPI
jgi:hypothetical protein